MAVPIDISQNIFRDWVGAYHQFKVDVNTTYICRATVGTLTSETGWQIFKLVDNSTERIITWPESGGAATTEFKFIADDYAGFTYS